MSNSPITHAQALEREKVFDQKTREQGRFTSVEPREPQTAERGAFPFEVDKKVTNAHTAHVVQRVEEVRAALKKAPFRSYAWRQLKGELASLHFGGA